MRLFRKRTTANHKIAAPNISVSTNNTAGMRDIPLLRELIDTDLGQTLSQLLALDSSFLRLDSTLLPLTQTHLPWMCQKCPPSHEHHGWQGTAWKISTFSFYITLISILRSPCDIGKLYNLLSYFCKVTQLPYKCPWAYRDSARKDRFNEVS